MRMLSTREQTNPPMASKAMAASIPITRPKAMACIVTWSAPADYGGMHTSHGDGAMKEGYIDVGHGINLELPTKSKPKGRTLDASEQKRLKLGAKGDKKATRKCKKCGIRDGHNAATCLQDAYNRERLASLVSKKRGRPPGSRNRHGNTTDVNKAVEAKRRRMVVSDDEDMDEDCPTPNILPLEDSSPAPRRRGRPPGAKNKRTAGSRI